MNATVPINARDAATLRAWLLALLRFAVTQVSCDRIVVLAAAAELDRPATTQPDVPAHRFFYRTSVTLCTAIVDPDLPGSEAALQQHLERIADLRLQRAFAAAADIMLRKPKPAPKRAAKPINLWRGLAQRNRVPQRKGHAA